jgi:hypothetical protein
MQNARLRRYEVAGLTVRQFYWDPEQNLLGFELLVSPKFVNALVPETRSSPAYWTLVMRNLHSFILGRKLRIYIRSVDKVEPVTEADGLILNVTCGAHGWGPGMHVMNPKPQPELNFGGGGE